MLDWKKLYQQGLNSPIVPKTPKDYVRKYCNRIRRKDIEHTILHHKLWKDLGSSTQFMINVCIMGHTNFYHTHDFMTLKYFFVLFRLYSEAKLGPREQEIFDNYVEALRQNHILKNQDWEKRDELNKRLTRLAIVEEKKPDAGIEPARTS
jgi:hypothetical protein